MEIKAGRADLHLNPSNLGATFNRQHSQGSDLNGDQGEAFFTNLGATVTGSRKLWVVDSYCEYYSGTKSNG